MRTFGEGPFVSKWHCVMGKLLQSRGGPDCLSLAERLLIVSKGEERK